MARTLRLPREGGQGAARDAPGGAACHVPDGARPTSRSRAVT
ncbi:hypothetical protein ACIF8T_14685 [Streptomyces sp. NPDC085946]